MNLAQLTAGMPELIAITRGEDTQIEALTADSRSKCRNGLFFCIRGGRVDAHDFAPQGCYQTDAVPWWWSAGWMWTVRRLS